MKPKSATHYGIGKNKKFYYRKRQIPTYKKHIPLVSKWEFYCDYQGKWIKSYCPHELVEL